MTILPYVVLRADSPPKKHSVSRILAITLALLTLAIQQVGCTPTTILTINENVAVRVRPENCSVPIGGEFAEISDDCVPIGEVAYLSGNGGFGCDWKVARKEIRKRACEAGATHARMHWAAGSCHRATAELFVCGEPIPTAPSQKTARFDALPSFSAEPYSP